MSKEAPIICDYMPKKTKLPSNSKQPSSINELSNPSPEFIIKKCVRSWKEVKKQIRKETKDPQKLYTDTELNEELEKAWNKCFQVNNAEEQFLFPPTHINYNPKTYVEEVATFTDIAMGLQNNSSLSFSKESSKDALEKSFKNGNVFPKMVKSELAANFKLEEEKGLTKEEKELARIARGEVSRIREEIAYQLLFYEPKVYEN